MSNILLINDIPCYMKVASSALNPILSYNNHQVFTLPTALISNTFNYNKFNILPLHDFMKDTLNVWKELGFKFECICVGYIVDETQQSFIKDYLLTSNAFKVIDPIMGDNKKLYNGMNKNTIKLMKELCYHGDLILPNYTEAALLTDVVEIKDYLSKTEIYDLLNNLKIITSKSIVVTSIPLENNNFCVAGYCHKTNNIFMIEYQLIQKALFGTGDIFSGVLVSNLLIDNNLENSTKKAMEFITRILSDNTIALDINNNIIIERYLHLL